MPQERGISSPATTCPDAGWVEGAVTTASTPSGDPQGHWAAKTRRRIRPRRRLEDLKAMALQDRRPGRANCDLPRRDLAGNRIDHPMAQGHGFGLALARLRPTCDRAVASILFRFRWERLKVAARWLRDAPRGQPESRKQYYASLNWILPAGPFVAAHGCAQPTGSNRILDPGRGRHTSRRFPRIPNRKRGETDPGEIRRPSR